MWAGPGLTVAEQFPDQGEAMPGGGGRVGNEGLYNLPGCQLSSHNPLFNVEPQRVEVRAALCLLEAGGGKGAASGSYLT